ncbi:MAG: rane protein [Neobacillus sp.]|nr:rane protein [Neobacillus sp.]
MRAFDKLKPGNILLVSLIGLIVITSLYLSNYYSGRKQSNSLIADITRNGKVIRKVDLNKIKAPQLILLKNNGLRLTVLAQKGKIRILNSECPDKICVISGWLSKPGESVVCMHSKTIVMIKGKGKKCISK